MTENPIAETKTEAQKTEAQKRDDALKKSYQIATKRLREAHPDEFNNLRVIEAKRLGYEWVPPKSEEQKAQEEYDALIKKYPHLAQQALPEFNTQS